jgi:dipeptidyl aminopeptidase/acylaminoacyl peptidase
VDEVTSPTLTLIGAADMRVPPSQGREWVAALESRQPRPQGTGAVEDAAQHDALEYEGEGHAIAGAEANAHAVQSAVAWLLNKLEVPAQ